MKSPEEQIEYLEQTIQNEVILNFKFITNFMIA